MIGLFGFKLRERKVTTKVAGGVLTPFLFFLISNFGVWLFGLNLDGVLYPKTVVGLIDCYAAGLPFLRGSVIGDWLFMGLFWSTAYIVGKTANVRFQRLVAEAKA